MINLTGTILGQQYFVDPWDCHRQRPVSSAHSKWELVLFRWMMLTAMVEKLIYKDVDLSDNITVVTQKTLVSSVKEKLKI